MLKLVKPTTEEKLEYYDVKQVIRQKRVNKDDDIIEYCKNMITKVNKLIDENGYTEELCGVGYACYYSIALEYKRQNKYHRAISFCHEAENWIDPMVFYRSDGTLTDWLLGECYYETKQYKKAKNEFSRCIKYYRAMREEGLRALLMFNKARMYKRPEKYIEKILISLKKYDSNYGGYFVEVDYMLQIAEYLKQLYSDKNDIFNSFRIDKTYIKPLKGGE